jgi:hypothetical protein
MKTRHKLKRIAAMIILPLSLSVSWLANAATIGGQEGNGGGGLRRNGIPVTFYSAGFFVEPIRPEVEDIPQLGSLLDFFTNTDILSKLSRSKYTAALMPSTVRRYYKVEESSFNSTVRDRLVAEYSRVMKINSSEVTLFAITDIGTKTTYLLPEFYNLKPSEQVAILYHEAYWLVNPTVSYRNVIESEMAFQNFWENNKKIEKSYAWINSLPNNQDKLTAVMKIDLETGSIKDLISKGRYIQASVFFGNDFLECKKKDSSEKACTDLFIGNVAQLARKYPKSLFFRFVYDKLATRNLAIFLFNENDTGKNGLNFLSTYFPNSNSQFNFIDLKTEFLNNKVEIDGGLYNATFKIRIFDLSADRINSLEDFGKYKFIDSIHCGNGWDRRASFDGYSYGRQDYTFDNICK